MGVLDIFLTSLTLEQYKTTWKIVCYVKKGGGDNMEGRIRITFDGSSFISYYTDEELISYISN